MDVSVQYNGGFLADIILLALCYYHRGTQLNVMKMFCLCSLCTHVNVLTILPLSGGCSEGLDAFGFFFKQQQSVNPFYCPVTTHRFSYFLLFQVDIVCLFVSPLRPMGLNVLGYRSHLLKRGHLACGHEIFSHLSPVLAYDFLSRCKFSTLTPRQSLVELCFPLRKPI